MRGRFSSYPDLTERGVPSASVLGVRSATVCPWSFFGESGSGEDYVARMPRTRAEGRPVRAWTLALVGIGVQAVRIRQLSRCAGGRTGSPRLAPSSPWRIASSRCTEKPKGRFTRWRWVDEACAPRAQTRSISAAAVDLTRPDIACATTAPFEAPEPGLTNRAACGILPVALIKRQFERPGGKSQPETCYPGRSAVWALGAIAGGEPGGPTQSAHHRDSAQLQIVAARFSGFSMGLLSDGHQRQSGCRATLPPCHDAPSAIQPANEPPHTLPRPRNTGTFCGSPCDT